MTSKKHSEIQIGIIGSGFIARGLVELIISKSEFKISSMFTSSDINKRDYKHKQLLTNSINRLISHSDIVIECSGYIIRTAEILEKIMNNNIPVITMNTEFNVTVGSYFVKKGFITEAEGDQPGCLAILHEEAVQMGFKPLVYGNIKGFLNENPTKEDMELWAIKNGISLEMTVSFTDGTKVQMEQAFVANGLSSSITQTGLTGYHGTNIKAHGDRLAKNANELGNSICDYVVSSDGPPGVFITATHNEAQQKSLMYYKMGEGPYYTLIKNYHLPHLEIYKTILRVINGGTVLLNNGHVPTISVAGVAKKNLQVGKTIKKAIGSFDIRGEAVKIKEYKNHIPIGLINEVIFKKEIKKNDIITFDDIEIKNNRALEIWQEILKRVLQNG